MAFNWDEAIRKSGEKYKNARKEAEARQQALIDRQANYVDWETGQKFGDKMAALDANIASKKWSAGSNIGARVTKNIDLPTPVSNSSRIYDLPVPNKNDIGNAAATSLRLGMDLAQGTKKVKSKTLPSIFTPPASSSRSTAQLATDNDSTGVGAAASSWLGTALATGTANYTPKKKTASQLQSESARLTEQRNKAAQEYDYWEKLLNSQASHLGSGARIDRRSNEPFQVTDEDGNTFTVAQAKQNRDAAKNLQETLTSRLNEIQGELPYLQKEEKRNSQENTLKARTGYDYAQLMEQRDKIEQAKKTGNMTAALATLEVRLNQQLDWKTMSDIDRTAKADYEIQQLVKTGKAKNAEEAAVMYTENLNPTTGELDYSRADMNDWRDWDAGRKDASQFTAAQLSQMQRFSDVMEDYNEVAQLMAIAPHEPGEAGAFIDPKTGKKYTYDGLRQEANQIRNKADAIIKNDRTFWDSVAYGFEMLGLGAVSAIEDIGRYAWSGITNSASSLISDLGGESEVARLAAQQTKDMSEGALKDPWITGSWQQSIDERYHPSAGEIQGGQFIETAGRMLPIMATGGVAGATGLPATAANAISSSALGLSAAGSSARSAANEGAEVDDALLYGALSGAVEAGIERVAGGIPGLGSGGTGRITNKILSRMDDEATAQAVRRTLGTAFDIFGEGAEEVVSSVLDPYLRQMTYDPDAEDVTIDELVNSFITGAALSSIFQAAQGGYRSLTGRNTTVPQGIADPNGIQMVPTRRQGIVDPNGIQMIPETQTTSTKKREPMHVGQATVIYQPYTIQDGPVPQNRQNAQTQTVQIGQDALDNAQNMLNQVRQDIKKTGASETTGIKNKLKDWFQNHFKGGVVVDGVDMNGQAYRVEVSNRALPKLLGYSKNTTKKLASLANLKSIIQNGTYLGSGRYGKNKTKQDRVIRYDYFETPVSFAGDSSPYVASFDVEVYKDRNNFRVYRINDIDVNKMTEDGYVGPEPTAASGQISADTNNISNSAENVNTTENILNRDAQIAANDPIAQANQALEEQRRQALENDPILKADRELRRRQQGATVDERIARDIEQYGAIPAGMEPRVERGALPRQTEPGTRTRQFARTVYENPNITDEMAADVKAAVDDGTFAYVPVGDARSIDQAKQKISALGFENAMKQWESVAYGTRPATKADIALAETMLTEAAAAGDAKTVLKLASELAIEGTRAGQVVQAMRMIKELSPEGKAYYLTRSVEKLNSDIQKRFKGKKEGVTLNEEYVEELLRAKTQEEIADAESKIMDDIASQVPSTIVDKLNAWRYFSMLGNPRTHLRNLAGNGAMAILTRIKDRVGATIEPIFIRNRDNRTKTWKPASKEQRNFAKEDFAHIKDSLEDGGKSGFADEIRKRKHAFDTDTPAGQILNSVTEFNTKALEWEDGLFLKPAYVHSFSKAMQARGITPEYLRQNTAESNQKLESLRKYATEEALRATFRETNALATALNQIENRNALTRVLVGGTTPFKKTPINILKRGVEYSPIGIVDGLYKTIVQVRRGKATGAQAIDRLSAGLTGTGVMALGAYLASIGALVASGDDEARKSRYDKDSGEQAYSLKIGDNYYTLDWLTPANMPLFIGAELFELTKNNEDPSASATRLFDAMTTVTDPMMQLSMLQGINDSLKAFGRKEGAGALGEMVQSSVESYLTQFIPTVSGQIARTIDPVRRTTYGGKEEYPGQEFVRKVANKIPGLSMLNEPYIDLYGNEQVNEKNIVLRFLENSAFPWYTSTSKEDEAIRKETNRLYEATGENTVLPIAPEDTIVYKGTKYELTAKEYTELKKKVGNTTKDILDDLYKDANYKALSDTEKAGVVERVYDYARSMGKKDALANHNVKMEQDAWIADWNTNQKQYEKAGITMPDYLLVKQKKGSATGVQDEYGNTMPGTVKQEVVDYIVNDLGFTGDAAAMLVEAAGYKADGDYTKSSSSTLPESSKQSSQTDSDTLSGIGMGAAIASIANEYRQKQQPNTQSAETAPVDTSIKIPAARKEEFTPSKLSRLDSSEKFQNSGLSKEDYIYIRDRIDGYAAYEKVDTLKNWGLSGDDLRNAVATFALTDTRKQKMKRFVEETGLSQNYYVDTYIAQKDFPDTKRQYNDALFSYVEGLPMRATDKQKLYSLFEK